MDVRKIIFIIIIVICIGAVTYGIYYQIFEDNEEMIGVNTTTEITADDDGDFDDLFDNQINYQDYTVSNISKIDQTEEVIYTTYVLNEVYENKYEIRANIPVINIDNSIISGINEEITSIFKDKITSIMGEDSDENQIYTVDYTAYVNENILSLVIKSTLKEGANAQRVIIKAYTYNLSTNQEITLAEMLEIESKSSTDVEAKIKNTIQAAVNSAENLSSLGYEVYERDVNSTIYSIENSNNYFLGPNGKIYIIYAYGNSSYTSERDIVVIE